jgi:hypothetical protein
MEPTIKRLPRHRQFVIIEQSVVEDSRLSWAARGVLGYLLSRPDDWQIRVTDLSRRGDLGRCSIYKLLKELRKFGYVTYHRQRNDKGQYYGGVYNVHEAPEPPRTKIPHVDIPDVVEPDTVPPDTVKQYVLPNTQDNLITTTTYETEKNLITTTTTTEGSGGNVELIYPKEILSDEYKQADKLVQPLPLVLAQQVLDEWAGIIAANAIRSSKLGCLRGLVGRAQEGNFTPEKGLSIKAARKRQQQITSVQEQVRKDNLPPPDPNSAIAKRINSIAARQRNKSTPE